MARRKRKQSKTKPKTKTKPVLDTQNPKINLGAVFLHYSNTYIFAKLIKEAKKIETYWGEIREVEANFEIVSNLVPLSLQHGAESWLILYRIDRPQELLILPCADENGRQLFTDTETFHDNLFKLFKLIRGDTKKWSVNQGFTNLRRHLDSNKYQKSRLLPKRFQLVYLHDNNDNFIIFQKYNFNFTPPEIRQTISRTVKKTQQLRNEALTSVLQTNDHVSKQQLLNKLDDDIANERNKLFKGHTEKVAHHPRGLIESRGMAWHGMQLILFL